MRVYPVMLGDVDDDALETEETSIIFSISLRSLYC